MARGPLGVLELGPLALHVVGQGAEGVTDLLGVGLEPVELSGHVGGLLADPVPLGAGVVGLLGLDQNRDDDHRRRGDNGEDAAGQRAEGQ